jgi:hypothetical protein
VIDFFYNPENWTAPRVLYWLAPRSWLLPLLIGLFSWRVHRREHLRILVFVGYSLLMDQVSMNVNTKNLFHPATNYPWFHLLVPGLFLLMTRFFTDYLKERGLDRLIWMLPGVYAALVALNAIWGDGFYNFPSGVVALYSITGIVLAIGYFAHLLQSPEELYLERRPMFWTAAGLLIYFAGNFLLWLGLNELAGDAEVFHRVYAINRVSTVLLNVAFSIALLLNPADRP